MPVGAAIESLMTGPSGGLLVRLVDRFGMGGSSWSR